VRFQPASELWRIFFALWEIGVSPSVTHRLRQSAAMARDEKTTVRLTVPLPLSFTFLGERWSIELAEISQSGGWWRCTLRGKECWFVAEAPDPVQLNDVICNTGFQVTVRSFPDTLFQHLARIGTAVYLSTSARRPSWSTQSCNGSVLATTRLAAANE
jgi:hypothetical protein